MEKDQERYFLYLPDHFRMAGSFFFGGYTPKSIDYQDK